MMDYLEFLGGEIRERRRRYNLPHSAKGLIICDQARQHTASKFTQLRDEWRKQHNVVPR